MHCLVWQVMSKTGWDSMRMMPIKLWHELQHRVTAENMWDIDYPRCMVMGKEMGLDVRQVRCF